MHSDGRHGLEGVSPVRLALLLLALASCDSWSVPHNVAFERMAAARLKNCVQGSLCQYVSQCHRESEAHCRDAGYRGTCGNGESEGSCGTAVR